LPTFSTVAAVSNSQDASLPHFALPFVTSGGISKADENRYSRPPLPPSASSFLLPTKHSRKRLPTVITDWTQLTDLAAELLSTETGRLFTYDVNLHTIDSTSTREQQPAFRSQSTRSATATTPQTIEKALLSVTASRNVAWHTSYATVATTEALIRGCAHGIHGTMWQRWVVPPSAASTSLESFHDANPIDLLQLQQSLLNRLYNEGYAYMTLRSLQLTERYGEKIASTQSTTASFEPALLEHSGQVTLKTSLPMLHDGNQDNDSASTSDDGSSTSGTTAEEQRDGAYLHDFALPGPTIAMYDTMLDTLASYCILLQEQEQNGHGSNSTSASGRLQETTVSHVLETANYLHDVAMLRHITDGGDGKNDNPYTRPTAVTFNALLRVAAELPIAEIQTETLSPVIRDNAITTAMSTFQALHECGVVHRNSASYTYAMRAVTKYLPHRWPKQTRTRRFMSLGTLT
jgi:hypothetical protein